MIDGGGMFVSSRTVAVPVGSTTTVIVSGGSASATGTFDGTRLTLSTSATGTPAPFSLTTNPGVYAYVRDTLDNTAPSVGSDFTSVTVTTADVFTYSNANDSIGEGQAVKLSSLTGGLAGTDDAGAALSTSKYYFARDVTATTFKIARVPGGTAVNITTAGTCTVTKWSQVVDRKITSSKVIIGSESGTASAPGSSLVLRKPAQDSTDHLRADQPGSASDKAFVVSSAGKVTSFAPDNSTVAYAVRRNGDVYDRFAVDENGKVSLGPGTDALDTPVFERTTAGKITLGSRTYVTANPTDALELATKGYVDSRTASATGGSGGSVTVDNSTIETNTSGALRIKDGGVTVAKLVNGSGAQTNEVLYGDGVWRVPTASATATDGSIVVSGFTVDDINAARNSAGAYGRVVFKPGVYNIGDTLQITHEGQVWVLHPNTTLKATGTGVTVLRIAAKNASVLGGTIDGNRTSRTVSGSGAVTVVIQNVDGVVIRDTRIINSAANAVQSNSGSFMLDRVVVNQTQDTAIAANANIRDISGIVIQNCVVDRREYALTSGYEGGGIKVVAHQASQTGFYYEVTTAGVFTAWDKGPTDNTRAVEAHGLSVGDKIMFRPNGGSTYAAGRFYYVKTVPSSTTFTVSSTSGGTGITSAIAGEGEAGWWLNQEVRITGNRVYQSYSQTSSGEASGGNECIVLQVQGLRHGIVANNHTQGGSMGISIAQSWRTTVTANSVNGFSKQGIEIAGAGGVNLTSGQITVSSNVVDGMRDFALAGPEQQHVGIVVWSGATNTSVIGNVVSGLRFSGTSDQRAGIRLQHASAAPRRVTVMGNQVLVGGGASALYNLRCSNVSVIGNVFDCTETNPAGTANTTSGILMDVGGGTVSGWIISGNQFISPVNALEVSGTGTITDFKVAENMFTSVGTNLYLKAGTVVASATTGRNTWVGNIGSDKAAIDTTLSATIPKL